MSPSPACTDLVRRFEGLRLTAYPDPATHGAPWTIGYGATGADIHSGLVWSAAQAEARLNDDLARFAARVSALLGDAPTEQHQFDAMVAFAFNLGAGTLASSTLLRLHKAADHAGAAAEFAKWTRAAGRVLPGLVKRRAAEAALYRES